MTAKKAQDHLSDIKTLLEGVDSAIAALTYCAHEHFKSVFRINQRKHKGQDEAFLKNKVEEMYKESLEMLGYVFSKLSLAKWQAQETIEAIEKKEHEIILIDLVKKACHESLAIAMDFCEPFMQEMGAPKPAKVFH